MTSRIPPLLEPYLSLPPEASLVLLTSVLSTSTNWLVLRYLHSTLAPATQDLQGNSGIGGDTGAVLISFLRDMAFWREGARRLGMDLAKLAAQRRFAFVDGLTGLFLPGSEEVRLESKGEIILESMELEKVYQGILGAVQLLQSRGGSPYNGRVLLIVDALDLLLATAGASASPVRLGDMLMDLREHVYATILTLSSDSPLVSRQQTPLEVNHANFLLSLAHQANITMSLRLLDTGTARDVSGVIRISIGEWVEREEGDMKVETRELLYFVAGDGNVKVFERGQ